MVERNDTVRVFVVADSAPVRRELLRLCNDDSSVDLVGITSSAHGVYAVTADLEPDLLLLHLDFRTKAEQELLDYFERCLPQSRIVLLSKPGMPFLHGRAFRRSLSAADGRRTLVSPDDHQQLRSLLRRVRDEKIDAHNDGYRAWHGGATGYQYGSLGAQSLAQEEKTRGVVRQITERRQKLAGRRRTEIQRMEAASRFQSLIEQLPGIPYIARLDSSASAIYVSPKIKEILGFTPEQWCAAPALRIRQLHAEDRPALLQAIGTAIACNSEYSIDYRIFGSDGSMHWFHDEARVMLDDEGKPVFLQGAALDITERKLAQRELERSHAELQTLLDTLDTLRMEEQKRLAHEMHDDFGQLLTAMKMDLTTLSRYLPQDDSHVVKQLNGINQLVDAMVTSVRRIIADLPPKILEDLGLFTALESLVRNFAFRHGIACGLRVSDTEPQLEARIAIAVYRMVQESLNNVAKHARASCAEVRIGCDSAAMTVHIEDNGCGMAMNQLRKQGSFGLIGMRERVVALGGKMHIESKEGSGTAIQIIIPLNSSAPLSK